MSLESVIQVHIRLRLSKLRMLFLRYQVGTFWTKDGRPVKIGEPGVSDLIGMVPHVVTEADVGRTIGVFTVLETKQVKDGTAKERKESQGNFLRLVNRGGGVAAIVRSEDDAVDVATKKWDSDLVKKFSA
jgi:hypothetical protein